MNIFKQKLCNVPKMCIFQIQFTLSQPTNELASIDIEEPINDLDDEELIDDQQDAESEASDQSEPTGLDPDAKKNIQDDKSQLPSDSIISKDQKNESSIPSAADPDGAKKAATPMSIDEMKRKATARRDTTIKNAKSALEKVKTDVETLKENADTERDEAFKRSNEQFKRAESMAAAVGRRASKKLREAKRRYRDEYKQAKSAAKNKFKDATEKYKDALEAADEEFEKARAQIVENQRNVEGENQDTLKKASEVKETALRLAREKMAQANETLKKARRNRGKLSPEERERITNEYQQEKDKYEEAVELAETEWEKVLDTLGIGSQYKAAEEEALKNLEMAQKKAEIMLQGLSEERDKALAEAKRRKQEVKKLAIAERTKAEDECDAILDKAERQQNAASKKIWTNWKKIQTQANDKLKEANTAFFKANNAAMNEYKKAMQTVQEMERNLSKVANSEIMSPEKVIEGKVPRLSTPRRRSSDLKKSEEQI